MVQRFPSCRAFHDSTRGGLKSWSSTGVGWVVQGRCTSRSAGSGWVEPGLRALQVLFGPAAAHADSAQDAISAFDEDRAEAGHDRAARQAVRHAEEAGSVPG